MAENESNFVGGQVSGLPLFEKKETATPRAEKAPPRRRKSDTHTPQQPATQPRTPSASDEEMLVRFGDLEVGAVFMLEKRPNTFFCYTKTATMKEFADDAQVLIFKRHAPVYVRSAAEDAAIEQLTEALREETQAFFNRGS